jgi:hypothetical protein
MQEILIKIEDIITRYQSGEYITKDKLIVLNRELSTNIYRLTKHNIEAFNDFNTIKYNENTSVAKAEIKAHFEVPELRITRKILEACKNVSISINNELSILKRE